MLASLPMYDLAELRPHTEALWAAIGDRLRAAGIAAPDRLARPRQLGAHWRARGLLLSQSCGRPLLDLPDRVRVVGTPVYAAPGCEGARYCSRIVVRDAHAGTDGLADLAGARPAVNALDSNSGWVLLRASFAARGLPAPGLTRHVTTGSHAASLAAVARGTADYAAIDCVTFALLSRHRPEALAGLRVVDRTLASLGLPLITAQDDSTLAALRDAFDDALCNAALAPARDALLLAGVRRTDRRDYDEIARLSRDAATLPD